MKIITRYVLKEHIGPFVFALSALTSLLLLQYIARRFGDLVGRGLSWQIITEFFLLSIPFTLAMTLPMAVLVSVLYAFTRLASENEITALKAGGVSSRALMRPAIVAATLLALFMLYFNDQLLPRANHELATLQMAILRTKPTFALKPQVINTIKESQLYLKAGYIDEVTGLMRDVTIHDVSNAVQRRTIYADSGTLAFAENRRDLLMRLFHGLMLTSPNDRPGQLTRVYYKQDVLKVRDVAKEFDPMNADTTMKGDREMTVCEMQRGYEAALGSVQRAVNDSVRAMWQYESQRGGKDPQPKDVKATPKGGIGALYCEFAKRVHNTINKYLGIKEMQAAEVPRLTRAPQAVQQPAQQDTAKKKKAPVPAGQAQLPDSIFVLLRGRYVKVGRNNIPDSAYYPGGVPAGKAAIAAERTAAPKTPPATTPGAQPQPPAAAPVPSTVTPSINPAAAAVSAHGPLLRDSIASSPEITDARMRLEDTRRRRNRYGIEIQKKFSLAASCIVFVLVGAPLALRFPRGGVGLVIGASFFVFAVYYVGLIGGESLANKNIVSPFWAMWVDNIIFLIVGLILMARMGNESITSRGGGMAERVDATRDWFARQGRRVRFRRRLGENT